MKQTPEQAREILQSIANGMNGTSVYVLDGSQPNVAEALQMGADALSQPTYNRHEVACILAEAIGDTCACNVNGIDEWLPLKCDFAEKECPNVVGVACWEQYLKHKEESDN